MPNKKINEELKISDETAVIIINIMIEKKYWPIILGLFFSLTLWHLYDDKQLLKPLPKYYALNAAINYTFDYMKLPPNDYDRLIDKDDFRFMLINKCQTTSSTPNNTIITTKSKESLILLVLVHTSPSHYDKRTTIRETWGQKRDNVRLLFAVGSVANQTVMDDISKENAYYGDILQGNFVDSYRNMTYKHVMLLKYVIYHCPNAKYILKTDDDVFVNMPRFLDFLTYDLSSTGLSNLLFCTPYENARARRSFRSKWRVTYEEFSDRYYPNYCPGWSLLYSPDVLFRLYLKVQEHKYFWIDDVLLTGILLKEIHLEHTTFDFLTLEKDVQETIVNGTIVGDGAEEIADDVKSDFLYGTPDIEENVIRSLWNYVDKFSQNRSVLANYDF